MMSARMPAPAVGASASYAREHKLAYRHAFTLTVDPERVSGHYEALRDACLQNAELSCSLISANISHDRQGGRPHAEVDARLPHEQVSRFIKIATRPMDGERSSDVHTVYQSTSAEDLTTQVADSDRRIHQLQDYRNRLEGLESQPHVETKDLIRIAEELSKTQTALDEAQSQIKTLGERIDTEEVRVSYAGNEPEERATSPLVEAWHNAKDTFIESCAGVLVFCVEALPWIPVILIAGGVIRLATRRWKWRRAGRGRRE